MKITQKEKIINEIKNYLEYIIKSKEGKLNKIRFVTAISDIIDSNCNLTLKQIKNLNLAVMAIVEFVRNCKYWESKGE